MPGSRLGRVTAAVAAGFLACLAAWGPAGAQSGVDLPALLMNTDIAPTRLTVDDPVYETRKTYEGYALRDVLKVAFPDLDAHIAANAELVMRARDGYAPTMPLSRALSKPGLIAFRDLSRPQASPFADVRQGAKMVNPAPYYLVWGDVAADDKGFPWPYQLVELELKGYRDQYGASLPEVEGEDRPRAMKGFHLFREHCMQCHAVNRIGGTVGPELNVPKSVTEYWKAEALPGFIRKASDYRFRSTMPDMTHLGAGKVDDILFYLRVKAREKVCDADRPCTP